jgi:hypothetical protein
MKSAKVDWLLAFLLCCTRSASVGVASNDIDTVRAILREAEAGRLPSGNVILETPLVGYRFHQELRQPSGSHVLVVAAREGGGILGFQPDGSKLGGIETGEIVSFQVIALDVHAEFSLVARQVDGAGTGYREENYHLYSVTPSRIEDVWEGTAYLLEIGPEENGKRGKTERRGFVDLDAGGFGSGPRLIHAVLDVQTGRTEYSAYSISNGRPTRDRSGSRMSRIPKS